MSSWNLPPFVWTDSDSSPFLSTKMTIQVCITNVSDCQKYSDLGFRQSRIYTKGENRFYSQFPLFFFNKQA